MNRAIYELNKDKIVTNQSITIIKLSKIINKSVQWLNFVQEELKCTRVVYLWRHMGLYRQKRGEQRECVRRKINIGGSLHGFCVPGLQQTVSEV